MKDTLTNVMKFLQYKKIIITACIVVVTATAFQPRPAEALFADWVNAGIQVVGHGIQGALLGVDAAANTLQAGLDSVKAFVDGLPIQYGPVRQGLSIAMASCDLMGGNVNALAEIESLTAPSSPSYDPELLDDRLIIPDGYQVEGLPNLGLPNNNGTVAGDSTTAATANISDLYKNKILAENSTVVGTKTLETPKISSSTNLDPLANQLVSVGDKTRTNLTLALTKKLGLMRYQKTCYKILDTSLKNSLLIASWNDQLKQAYEDTFKEIAVRKSTVDRNVNSVEAQLTAAQHEVYHAIAASVAADINEQKTLDTVAELKPKLTVANYNQTIDALAKQVYAPKAIKEKYGSEPSTQFILGALLNAEITTDKYAKQQAEQTAISGAKTALYESGACAQPYDYADFTNYSSILEASNSMQPGCDEAQVMDSYRSKFSEIMAESKKAAELELTNGGGFLSTRLCKASDQALREQLVKATEAARKAEQATLNRQAFEKQGSMRDPKYIEAINAEKTAIRALQDITIGINGGVEEQCGPIDDAGGVSKALFESYVGQWIANPKLNDANPNLTIKHNDTIASKLFGQLILNATEPRSVVSLLSKNGEDFFKALLTGRVVPKQTVSSANGNDTALALGENLNAQVAGEVTKDSQVSEVVPVIPYTAPRGDYGINRGR
jgi:hypothetical protein